MFYIDWPKSLQYVFIVIDILAVTYIFYNIIIYIFYTKTINILKGTIAVAFVFFLATFFKLKTLLWFFEKSLEVLPLAILIIFQPEIRRILTNLGTLKVFSTFDKKYQEDSFSAYQKIFSSLQLLSDKKIGALILIQQDAGLENIKEKAVTINAEITEQLLLSIFIPSSPLHDGSIIIKDNKIVVAHAFFPITEEKIMPYFGSRHRAALGITEITDAIALVASEETGFISIAYQGKIFYNIGINEVKQKVMDIIGYKK